MKRGNHKENPEPLNQHSVAFDDSSNNNKTNRSGFWSYVTFSNLTSFLAIVLFYWSMKNVNAFTVYHYNTRSNARSSNVRNIRSEYECFHSKTISLSRRDASTLSVDLDYQSESPVLPEGSFAGMVERRLIQKFGSSDIQRILQSWRLLEMNYEHKETVKEGVEQLAVSYVPGLTPKCFWDTKDISWCKALEKNYEAIKQEFLLAVNDPDRLEKEGNNVWAGALTDDASSYGVGWSTLVLMDRGVWDPTNVSIFPKTSKIVHDSGIPAVEVFFASMKPNSNIKMHSDFTNFVLTSHLAIDIPYSGDNKCRLTVGDETRQWINGEVSLFDTSIMHDAVNESDKTRYILMFRLWHPELTTVERDALQFLYDCLEIPDLASPDPGSRFMAEQRISMRHAFPSEEAERAINTRSKSSKSKKKKNVGGKGFGK